MGVDGVDMGGGSKGIREAGTSTDAPKTVVIQTAL
jgi:hypothetical protein